MTYLQIGGGMWAARFGNDHGIICRSHYIGGYEWSIRIAGRGVVHSGWTKTLRMAAENARRYFEGRPIVGDEQDAALEARWRGTLAAIRSRPD